MTRTKAFDPDQALDAAMRLFWRKGYNAASMQDLVEATGVNRASLYATFGGKDALFAAAIEHYLQAVNRARLKDLREAPSAKAGLEAYFDDLVHFAAGEGRQLGCLLTNTAVERAACDEAIGKRLFGIFDDAEALFAEVVERGQAAGEIAPERDPRATARFLVTLINGLRVMSRVRAEEAWLRDAASGLQAIFIERPSRH